MEEPTKRVKDVQTNDVEEAIKTYDRIVERRERQRRMKETCQSICGLLYDVKWTPKRRFQEPENGVVAKSA